MPMIVLVSGAAGFIGFHVALRLLARGDSVIGVDNLSDYYDVSLKEARLSQLKRHDSFQFHRLDLVDRPSTQSLFEKHAPERVIHLAAQAGVRYSIENPHAYIDSNLVGFGNVLEGCRNAGVEHLVFASTSAVYGANEKLPFSVEDNVDHPVSLYAATKKANELMAHAYSHLYRIPTTGLRFFTVYGPWGRPDMALFSFTRAILEGQPIDVYNNGNMRRDFTFIDDIVEGVVRTLDNPAEPDSNWSGLSPQPASSSAPYRLYNIGNHEPVELLRFVKIIETCLGTKAKKNLLPLQTGDVPATYADVEALAEAVGFRPSTPIKEGVGRFVDWFREYYNV